MKVKPEAVEIEEVLLGLCAARGADKSICPSEAARALAQTEADWRALMPAVRSVAAGLSRQGKIRFLQGGRTVDPDSAKGPIRLASVPDAG